MANGNIKVFIQNTGFIIGLTPKKNSSDFYDLLSYGKEGDLHPDQLLRRGGASLFQSEEKAWAALKESLRKSEDMGCKWVKDYWYKVFPVEVANG